MLAGEAPRAPVAGRVGYPDRNRAIAGDCNSGGGEAAADPHPPVDADLKAATSPAEIDRIVRETNETALSAWNLLDEGEQKRLAPQFIDRLEGTEDLAGSRLSVVPLDYGLNPMVGMEQQELTRAQTEAATATGKAAADLSLAATAFSDLMTRLMPRQEQGAEGLVAAGNALTSAATALAYAATATREVGY